MIDNDLIDIFDDCLNRLATGETVEQCLRRYPAHADALRPMLQTVRLVQRAVPSEDEVSLARMRSRARVQDALNTAATSRARRSPVSRWWLGVAALLLVCIGVGAVAFNSLPGDPLYALKRGVEDSAIILSADRDAALEAARQRRIDEVTRLLTLGRVASVEFSGNVDSIVEQSIRVSGLDVTLTAATARPPTLSPGDRVTVRALTTPDRVLIAQQISLDQPAQIDLTPEITAPVPSATSTQTATTTTEPTATMAATTTSEPSVTPVPATATAAATRPPAPSHTPTATQTLFAATTWTPLPSLTPSSTPAETRLPSQRANCLTQRPPGWVTYTVRAGDSLSGLATATGTSISMIRELNCLPETGLILAGQPLYLPQIPPTRPPSAGIAPRVTTGDNSDDSSGHSGPGSNDDSSGNRGSGHDDDDDDGGDNRSG